MESPPQVDGEKCDTVPQGVQELLDGRNRQYPCAAMPKSRRAVPPVYPQPWSHKNQTPLPSPCALTYRAMPCPRRPKTRLQTHRGLETSEPANCQHRPLPDDEGGRTAATLAIAAPSEPCNEAIVVLDGGKVRNRHQRRSETEVIAGVGRGIDDKTAVGRRPRGHGGRSAM